jgi:hypothetical protein
MSMGLNIKNNTIYSYMIIKSKTIYQVFLKVIKFLARILDFLVCIVIRYYRNGRFCYKMISTY